MPTLISPYGGELIDLVVPRAQLLRRSAHANTLPSIQVSPRIVCDLELLAGRGVLAIARLHVSGGLPRRPGHHAPCRRDALPPCPSRCP